MQEKNMKNKKLRKFSMQEITIMQMICEYSYAEHTDQKDLFTYFNPTDVNTLGFFRDKDFASEYSREFFDWVSREYVPEFQGYQGELKKLSDEDKETVVELSDDFFKAFDIEEEKAEQKEAS